MFITAIQNAVRRELFRGSMHRGKYRYVRPIKIKEMNLLREEYKREERVSALLMNPYLSKEESYGHTIPFQKHENMLRNLHEKRRLMKLEPNVYLEDRLVHLTFNDKWD